MKLAVFLLMVAHTGCSDGDPALTITRFAVEEPRSSCVIDSRARLSLERGMLDVGIVQYASPLGYMAVPIVQNLTSSSSADGSMGLGPAVLTGFDVEVVVPPVAGVTITATESQYRTPVQGITITPGETAAVALEVVPRSIAVKLAASFATQPGSPAPVHATVRLRAVGTRANTTLSGPLFTFPIDLCYFCITTPPQACPSGGFSASQFSRGGCFSQQDDPITCCGSGDKLVCGNSIPGHP